MTPAGGAVRMRRHVRETVEADEIDFDAGENVSISVGTFDHDHAHRRPSRYARNSRCGWDRRAQCHGAPSGNPLNLRRTDPDHAVGEKPQMMATSIAQYRRLPTLALALRRAVDLSSGMPMFLQPGRERLHRA